MANDGIAIINRVVKFQYEQHDTVTPVCFQPSEDDARRLASALNREFTDFFEWFRIEHHDQSQLSHQEVYWEDTCSLPRCQSRLKLLMDGCAIHGLMDGGLYSITYAVAFLQEQPERYIGAPE